MAPYDQQGARDMYLNTNFTQKEIAEKLGIDPKTIYLWIKKGKWDEMKAAARQAPGIIQQQLYNHITAINDSIADRDDHLPTFQEVEMLRKLIVSTKHMQQMSVGTYIQAFQELTGFIGPHTNDLEFTKRVAVVADEYIKGLVHNKQFPISEQVRNTTEAINKIDNNYCHSDNRQSPQAGNTISCCHPDPDNHREPMSPFRSGEVSPTSSSVTIGEPPTTSLSFLTAEASAKEVGEPARTTFQLGGGRGEAPSIRQQTGNAENDENPVTPSPSISSLEMSTTSLPDSIALPEREMKIERTPEEQEKHTRDIEQIITREDYIKYEYLLEEKTNDLNETVDFNGVKANLMTVQYNLRQFEQPEWRRHFLSREEVIAHFNKYGCW